MTDLEIAAGSALDARVAFANGADRVELSQALSLGGLTPSACLIREIVEASPAGRVLPLIRPRPGGFVYTDEEVDLVSRDIDFAVECGVGGVVVGALTADGLVDLTALEKWREASPGVELVFHRAIDAVPLREGVIGQLLSVGVDRILTSGGAVHSVDGLENLAYLVEASKGRLQILAGGGVRPIDVPQLVSVGVSGIHLSARTHVGTDQPAGPGGGETGYDMVDGSIVKEARLALDSVSPPRR